MLKKTVKYIDFDGNEREEDHYFHLNKVELTEMEVENEGGMTYKLQQIIQELDRKKMVEMFKDIILRSYGEKSPDGKHFIKSKEITDRFACTEAFVEVYMEVTASAENAAAFVNGIIPPLPKE